MSRPGAKPTPVEVRFWRHVSPCPNTGCWWWMGAIQRKGYGHMGRGGRGAGNVICSRLSYQMHYGVDPGELFVLHRCDSPACVNPEHLFLGTNKDNMADCAKKGRVKWPAFRGEKHIQAKLTADLVRLIRASPLSCAKLGSQLGVRDTTIHSARTRKTWKHVE